MVARQIRKDIAFILAAVASNETSLADGVVFHLVVCFWDTVRKRGAKNMDISDNERTKRGRQAADQIVPLWLLQDWSTRLGIPSEEQWPNELLGLAAMDVCVGERNYPAIRELEQFKARLRASSPEWWSSTTIERLLDESIEQYGAESTKKKAGRLGGHRSLSPGVATSLTVAILWEDFDVSDWIRCNKGDTEEEKAQWDGLVLAFGGDIELIERALRYSAAGYTDKALKEILRKSHRKEVSLDTIARGYSKLRSRLWAELELRAENELSAWNGSEAGKKILRSKLPVIIGAIGASGAAFLWVSNAEAAAIVVVIVIVVSLLVFKIQQCGRDFAGDTALVAIDASHAEMSIIRIEDGGGRWSLGEADSGNILQDSVGPSVPNNDGDSTVPNAQITSVLDHWFGTQVSRRIQASPLRVQRDTVVIVRTPQLEDGRLRMNWDYGTFDRRSISFLENGEFRLRQDLLHPYDQDTIAFAPIGMSCVGVLRHGILVADCQRTCSNSRLQRFSSGEDGERQILGLINMSVLPSLPNVWIGCSWTVSHGIARAGKPMAIAQLNPVESAERAEVVMSRFVSTVSAQSCNQLEEAFCNDMSAHSPCRELRDIQFSANSLPSLERGEGSINGCFDRSVFPEDLLRRTASGDVSARTEFDRIRRVHGIMIPWVDGSPLPSGAIWGSTAPPP